MAWVIVFGVLMDKAGHAKLVFQDLVESIKHDRCREEA